MGILNSAGQSFSDADIKSFFASSPTGDQIAGAAAKYGLNQSQVNSAMGIAGVGGASASDRDSTINGYMQGNTGGYSWGSDGKLGQPTVPGYTPPSASGGGIAVGGKTYTDQQVKDFYAGGGNDVQFAQQNGMTDLGQIHDLAIQARGIAGDANPTGDAALQGFFKQYQQHNPNGANANNYAGWLANQGAHTVAAMRGGGYTGAVNDPKDYDVGGIYGPGSSAYGKPGYASGLGPRGDGGSWDSGGAPGAGGGAGGVAGIIGGSGGAGASSSTSSSGGTAGTGNTAQWDVTAPQTVEGRIAGILNPNNPIIQQARTGAREAMNERGMMNSSLATTAGDAAAYQAAIPIAAADAATFAKASGYNADQINQFSTNALNRQSQMDLANLSAKTQLSTAQLSANTQLTTAQLNADTQKYLAGLDNTQKAQAQDLQLKNATLLNTNTQAAGIFNTGMSAINNITQNNQMDADTKTRATANVWHDVQTQLNVLGATSGLDLSSKLNFANYPGFDAQGQWVGFPAASTPTGNGAATGTGGSDFDPDAMKGFA